MSSVRRIVVSLFIVAIATLALPALADTAKAAPAKAPTPAAEAAAPSKAKPDKSRATGPAVAGRAAGPDGKPLAGAIVRAVAVEDRGGPFGRRRGEPKAPVVLKTGEDGSFRVEGVDGPKLRVRIEADGLAPFNADDVPRGASLDVKMKAGLPLEGRVLDMDAREAVPGAIVVAFDRGAEGFGLDAGIRAKAGDDGRFTIGNVPSGTVVLEAWSPRHAVVRRADVPVKTVAPDGAEARVPALELFLRPGGRVAGRVVGADGKPVDEARVSVAPTQGRFRMMDMQAFPRAVTTDAAGRFAIEGVPVGRYEVRAAKDGHSDAKSDAFEIERGTVRADLEIKLEASASLAFRLVDADDKPVTGVSVGLAPSGAQGRRRGRAALRFGAADVADDQIESGDDGRVVVRGLDVGSFEVSIRPDDGAEIEKDGVRLRAGETTDLGTLRVVEGTYVSGRVTDKVGDPVAGATVSAMWTDGMQPRRRSVKTKTDGRYKLAGLGDQPLRSMWVEAKGFGGAERDGVAPGDSGVDFTLERNGSIVGKVVLADGSVPVAFKIKAHPEAQAEANPFSFRGMFRGNDDNAFTDPEGKFRLDDVQPGTVTVEATAIGKAPSRKTGVTVAAEEVVDVGTLVLEDGRTLKGRVLSAADGIAVAGAAALVETAQGGLRFRMPGTDASTGGAVSGSDGLFEIRGLEGRTYTLAVEHPDYAPSQSTVEVPADEDPPEVVVRLSRGGTLTGTVRDAGRQPVAEATIVAMRGMFGSDMQAAQTGPDGVYLMEKLAPGAYNVMRPPEDGGIAGLGMKQATIKDGETTVVDFDENAKHTLTGRVLKGDQSVPDASLLFFPGEAGFGGAGMKTSQSDAEGRYQIGLDQPGTYTVIIQARGGFRGGNSLKITVPDAPTATIDLVMRSGGITGRVTDPDAKPVSSAMVTARRDGATDPMTAGGSTTTDPDGSFTIETSEPGTYRVTASASGFAPAEAYPVVVADDQPAPNVDLRLERGRVLRGRVVDPRGTGVQGAFVVPGRSGSPDPAGNFATTDINGAFALTVGDDASYDVAAIATGFAPGLVTGVTPVGEGDESEVTVPLGAGARARIEVVGQDGTPVAGAQVLLRANPKFLGSDMISFVNRPAPTGPDGATSASALRPGTYDVVVQLGPRSTTAQLSISEGGEAFARVTLP